MTNSKFYPYCHIIIIRTDKLWTLNVLFTHMLFSLISGYVKIWISCGLWHVTISRDYPSCLLVHSNLWTFWQTSTGNYNFAAYLRDTVAPDGAAVLGESATCAAPRCTNLAGDVTSPPRHPAYQPHHADHLAHTADHPSQRLPRRHQTPSNEHILGNRQFFIYRGHSWGDQTGPVAERQKGHNILP